MQYIYDAELVAQQKVSPLELIARKVVGGEKQARLLTEGGEPSTALVPSSEVKPNDLLEEMFRPAPEKTIRTILKPEDSALFRRALLALCRTSLVKGDETAAKVLWARMFRSLKCGI
jgi:hypothetical protein